MPHLIGSLSANTVQEAQAWLAGQEHSFAVLVAQKELEDATCVEQVLSCFPPLGKQLRADVWLILTECFANAFLHGRVECLSIAGHAYHQKLALRIWHKPPMPQKVKDIIKRAKDGWLPDYEDPGYFGSGLGYPLLVRLSGDVHVSSDCAELHFWFEHPTH